MRKNIKHFVFTALVAILASGLTFLVAESYREPQRVVIEKQLPAARQVDQPSDGQSVRYVDFSEVAAKVTPTVVHIQSIVKDGGSAQLRAIPSPFDFFGPGFRQFERVPQPSVSTGSGVIVNEEGYIVTNNHVVEDADEVEVTLHDKRTIKAEIVGTDPSTDLALLKIEAENLQSLDFGNSDGTSVGQWVLAVGNPFNLESTVTAGIISAKARNINILKSNTAIESFIQTDAAVNPGNSGGALVNDRGELVGINTAIASQTGSFAGYAFAVPSNIASKVIEDLMNYGVVQRAFIGVNIQDLDGKLAEKYRLDRTSGVYVAGLSENGAAAAAGLKEGDVIISIDHKEVKSAPELQEIIGRKRPGDVVTVGVDRNGSIKEFTIELRNKSGNTDRVKRNSQLMAKMGVELAEISASEAKKLGISKGVKITEIQDGSLANIGIREGFIITHVNDQEIGSVADFEKALEQEQSSVKLRGTYPGSRNIYYFNFNI